nr:pyridoxal-phosphate dependent enzyme [Jiangella mangrovi]
MPDAGEFVTLGEGDTPLVDLPVLARRLGLARLSAKMESQNPTGSYKDRVAALSVSLARQQGRNGWIASSSGNAGLAMAAYGARAGLRGFLCLVASAPVEKRLPVLPYGVELIGVDGVGDGSTAAAIDALVKQLRMASERYDLFLGITAHAFNPDGMRGIDTIGYELAEQAPDLSHLYVPAGGGGLLAAVTRGLRARGMRARTIACQPSGCAPIVAFLDGAIATPAIDRCESGISALQIPDPPDGDLAAQAVISTQGWGTAVGDDAILAAQRMLAEVEGLFVEPAAAATLAGLVADVERGRVAPDSRPVLVLSGAGWKDLGRIAAATSDLPVVAATEVAHHIGTWFDGRNGQSSS